MPGGIDKAVNLVSNFLSMFAIPLQVTMAFIKSYITVDVYDYFARTEVSEVCFLKLNSKLAYLLCVNRHKIYRDFFITVSLPSWVFKSGLTLDDYCIDSVDEVINVYSNQYVFRTQCKICFLLRV